MTLDKAIIHAEEVANSKCDECGAEHRQLAEWLKDYKRLLEQEPKTDGDGSHEIITGFGRINGKTYPYKKRLEDGKRKALDQEPKTDILDKIMAEIEELNNIDYVKQVTVEEILKIIDKYREDKK